MRRAVTLAVLLLGPSLLASPALAGGSHLTPRERSYAWGEIAVARERFSHPLVRYRSRRGVGTVEDAPFYAYLVPEGRFLRADRPIPPYAVPLGRIRFERVDPDSICCHIARLRFVVPEVPPGEYFIDTCNASCTVTDIGFSAGSVLIGSSPLEARLLETIERTRFRINGVRRELRVQDGLRDRFQDANAEIERLRGLLDRARVRLDNLESRPHPRAETPPDDTAWVPIVVSLIAFLAVTATVATVMRRRRRRQPAAGDVRPAGQEATRDVDELVPS